MRFGDDSAGGMDMHVARERLREERDRQLRALQDDDRKRGILAGGADVRREGPSALMRIPKENDAAQGPRRVVVSGASQLVAPRDASPSGFDQADVVLCVITLVSAVNPSHSWTMPATSHLWNQLESSALVPRCDPPVPLHRTVVASATHTNRTLSLLSEYCRDVMLSQTECATCILSGPRVLHSDRAFWTTWDPAVPVDADEHATAHLAGMDAPYQPQLPISTMAFPGELLQPAPSLVGRVWPSGNETPGGDRGARPLDDDDI